MCNTHAKLTGKCEHGELPDEHVLPWFDRRDDGFSGTAENYSGAYSTAEHEVLCSFWINRAKDIRKMKTFFFSYNEDLLKAEHSPEISE